MRRGTFSRKSVLGENENGDKPNNGDAVTSGVPRISVVMPVLNRENLLAASIDSLLRQTFTDWELVVSDGGSTDGTVAMLERYARDDSRVRVYVDPGTSTVQCRNAILPRLRGEYVAVLDSDDIALPERLERQHDFLEAYPEFIGTGSAIGFIDADGAPVASEKYAMRLTDPLELRRRQREGWNCFVHSSMLVRRSTISVIGGYRNIFRHAEDDDFFLRLLDYGDLANMPEVLVLFRHHAENTSAPTMAVLMHRVAALASAHLRLAGKPDALETRIEAIDYVFLQNLFDALDSEATSVMLAWIGLLQHYRIGDDDALLDAWRRLAALPRRDEWAGEIARHGKNCQERFPAIWNNCTL